MSVQDVIAAAARDRESAVAALTGILPRVTALNSFVRSEASRRHWHTTSIHRVVYHYKREALKQAENYRIATHRRIGIAVKCRDCGGSGRYTDWSGYEHAHCWACSNSGTAQLKFIESTLPGGLVWHSPERDAYSFLSHDQREALPQAAVAEWTVHQVGEDLTPSEVAAHLLAVEAFFPKRPPVQHGQWSDFDIANTYTLWIGTTERGHCYLCSATIDRIYGGHCVRSGRVAWNGIVCNACDKTHDDVFTRLAPLTPREFITPAIAEWIAAHPVPVETLRRPIQVVSSYPAVDRGDDSDIPF